MPERHYHRAILPREQCGTSDGSTIQNRDDTHVYCDALSGQSVVFPELWRCLLFVGTGTFQDSAATDLEKHAHSDPILMITAVLDLFLIDTGDTYFKWRFLEITSGGVRTAILMIVRILVLLAGSSLLTYTTSPIALTDAIERLLSPLKRIHVPGACLCDDDDHCAAFYSDATGRNRQDCDRAKGTRCKF